MLMKVFDYCCRRVVRQQHHFGLSEGTHGGEPVMTSENILTIAHYRLAQHANNIAEILDGLCTETWDDYAEAEDQFHNYAEEYTWWNAHIFQIYLSGGASSDHLDLHVSKTLEPMRLIYHLELIAGGADILVAYDTSIYVCRNGP